MEILTSSNFLVSTNTSLNFLNRFFEWMEAAPSWYSSSILFLKIDFDLNGNLSFVSPFLSDKAKLYKLYSQAMKMIPGSPAQKKVKREIERNVTRNFR